MYSAKSKSAGVQTEITATHRSDPEADRLPFSGVIYYRPGLFIRPCSIWCSPSAQRTDVRLLMTYRLRSSGRWSLHVSGDSVFGELSTDLNASKPHLVGVPARSGKVRVSGSEVAEVICDPGPTLLCVLSGLDGSCRVSVQKCSPSTESDVVVADAKTGELAVINRKPTESLREQVESRLGLGLSHRGSFTSETPAAVRNRTLAICLVAALSLYFPHLENLLNTSYPSG